MCICSAISSGHNPDRAVTDDQELLQGAGHGLLAFFLFIQSRNKTSLLFSLYNGNDIRAHWSFLLFTGSAAAKLFLSTGGWFRSVLWSFSWVMIPTPNGRFLKSFRVRGQSKFTWLKWSSSFARALKVWLGPWKTLHIYISAYGAYIVPLQRILGDFLFEFRELNT